MTSTENLLEIEQSIAKGFNESIQQQNVGGGAGLASRISPSHTVAGFEPIVF
jgi:hypothetical protein